VAGILALRAREEKRKSPGRDILTPGVPTISTPWESQGKTPGKGKKKRGKGGRLKSSLYGKGGVASHGVGPMEKETFEKKGEKRD